MIITGDMLRKAGMFAHEVYAFEDVFPKGFRVTVRNCRKLQRDWFLAVEMRDIVKKLAPKQFKRYMRYTETAMRRHRRYCAPSWRAYERNEAEAFCRAIKESPDASH